MRTIQPYPIPLPILNSTLSYLSLRLSDVSSSLLILLETVHCNYVLVRV